MTVGAGAGAGAGAGGLLESYPTSHMHASTLIYAEAQLYKFLPTTDFANFHAQSLLTGGRSVDRRPRTPHKLECSR